MRWRLLAKRCCACGNLCKILACCTLLAVFVILPNLSVNRIKRAFRQCSDEEEQQFLSNLCVNFTRGIISGPLCRPLCLTYEIAYKKCLGHGNKIVIEGTYRNRAIVLKASKRSVYQYHFPFDDASLENVDDRERDDTIREGLLTNLNDAVKPIAIDRKTITKQLLGDKKTNLTRADALTLFSLLDQDEFVRLLLLAETSHVPALHGWCGHVYAVESISGVLGLDIVRSSRPWRQRARIALSFLDMIKSFESTPYGELALCDVQEPNFAVATDMTVYAIDVDLAFFPTQLKVIIDQPMCQRDDECEFFDCVSFCDATAGKCTANVKTNSFQILCADIFSSKFFGLNAGLLANPPKAIAARVGSLVSDCKRTAALSQDPIPRVYYEKIYDDLRDLLSKSI